MGERLMLAGLVVFPLSVARWGVAGAIVGRFAECEGCTSFVGHTGAITGQLYACYGACSGFDNCGPQPVGVDALTMDMWGVRFCRTRWW